MSDNSFAPFNYIPQQCKSGLYAMLQNSMHKSALGLPDLLGTKLHAVQTRRRQGAPTPSRPNMF